MVLVVLLGGGGTFERSREVGTVYGGGLVVTGAALCVVLVLDCSASGTHPYAGLSCLRIVWRARMEASTASDCFMLVRALKVAWAQGRCDETRSLPCIRSNTTAAEELVKKKPWYRMPCAC